MARNVFILGAGASKEVGAPLMNNFLEVSENLLRSNLVEEFRSDFELVFEGRSTLMQTHSKSIAIDIYNMEAVFSAFEMGKMLGSLGRMDKEKVARLPESYRAVIAETLDKTVQIPDHYKASTPYSSLVEFSKEINKVTHGSSSFITFNYDLALDHELNRHYKHINYCLTDSDLSKKEVPLLKLHGSLNWKQCHKCNTIVAWPIQEILQRVNRISTTEKFIKLPVSSNLRHWSHCENSYSDKASPYLVPPTWNKSEHHKAIEHVWRTAAKELSESENIFIIGYSLPETDSFFNYLFSLGTCSDQIFKRFWIVDPCKDVEQKYRRLISPSALSAFRFFPATFSEGMKLMAQELKNLK